MARFLLDTNACIEILRGRNPVFAQRFREHQGEQPAICTVVWAELLVGARLSPDPATARRRLDLFAELPCPGFSRTAAEHYAEVRALLQRQGQLIGPNDLFIASIALAHNLHSRHPQHPRILPSSRLDVGRLGNVILFLTTLVSA